MIYPFLNYKKVLTSTIAPYEYFKRIEQLDLNEKILNKFNLVSSLESTDPLVIKFRNQRDFTNRYETKHFSSSVIVSFFKTGNEVSIHFQVKSNPIYFFLYAVLLLNLIVGILANGFDKNEIGVVLIFVVVAVIDWFTKMNILSRVESVINQ